MTILPGHLSRRVRRRFACAFPLVLLLVGVAGGAPLDPPAKEVLLEAQQIVQEMKQNPRGPYRRIRWFCADGTTQAPVAYACREHGGGRQHAEFSQARARLAELGWHVGTIFAALDPEAPAGGDAGTARLRELALERYLIDIDDGWVLQKAQGYRGRVQVEDEQASGRRLLLRVLTDDRWLEGNFLLTREFARVVPHGEDTDLARNVRRAAIELAELEPAAERWRAEIHAAPDASTARRLRAWLRSRRDERVTAIGGQLADDLDALYGERGRRERTEAQLAALPRSSPATEWRASVRSALALPPRERVDALCSALAGARRSALPMLPPGGRLAMLDAMQSLETETQLAFAELQAVASRSRRDVIDLTRSLLQCAYGSGLLSAREQHYVDAELDFDGEEIPLPTYRDAILALKRVPGWATGTIRHSFADALTRYTALDPRTARFSDDLLRGSPLWMLGTGLRLLAADENRLDGSVVEIAGSPVSTALALNAGIARGTLRIFATLDEVADASLSATEVVVLPETIAELAPVAGILTLGEGNPVSHVQLLARNFAIPNVAIDDSVVTLLEPLRNREVVLVVGNAGDVILREADADTLDAIRIPSAVATPASISVPVPDLRRRAVLQLDDIGRELSGKVVGPKAANLGELHRLFPGRVAPAVAIPFGVYAAHLAPDGLDTRIRKAFANRANGTMSHEQMLAELARIRSDIAGLELSAPLREELERTMAAEFGEAGPYGVFVRSDTNVEDLPQFTGAGLNETVPNVVGLDEQLRQIPRVWSSVLSPRALAWRSSVLANPDRIYASVLLMKSVPADKSGVLITADLYRRDADALTVSTAWGVGGAVAGEAAETLLIRDGKSDLVSEAKAPYRRHLAPEGGVSWQPAPAGAVLTDDDIAALQQLAREVERKYEPVEDDEGRARPWDIEFGFVDGALTLFQIRPFVDRTNRNIDAVLHRLNPATENAAPADATVSLREPVVTER